MKKINVLFIALVAILLVGTPQTARAQKKPETLTITKFVVSASGQELQMHQRPDINSPKLVFLRDEEFSAYEPGELKWDNKRLKRSLVTPAKSKVFAVVGEVGNWYKVYDGYYKPFTGLLQQVGYLPKKDCEDAVLLPITPETFSDFKNGFGDITVTIHRFSEDNVCVMSWGYPLIGFSVGGDMLQMGRIVDNVAYLGDFSDYGIDVDQETNIINIGYSVFQDRRLIRINDNWKCVDCPKLTASEIQKIQRENENADYEYAIVSVKGCEIRRYKIGKNDNGQIVNISLTDATATVNGSVANQGAEAYPAVVNGHLAFMGIPINTPEESFRKQLLTKGFKVYVDDYGEVYPETLIGMYKGRKVQVQTSYKSVIIHDYKRPTLADAKKRRSELIAQLEPIYGKGRFADEYANTESPYKIKTPQGTIFIELFNEDEMDGTSDNYIVGFMLSESKYNK